MWYWSSQNRALLIRKLRDLVAAVVEDVGAPVGVQALLRVGVLVQVRAVEISQAVLVAAGSGRAPSRG